ncbi:MAG: YqgE/AlgH family protein [Planctomycetaceae bacterium]|nr:YqgE/AlgH family protein [Planctomycetaceae bacterium]
MSHSLRGHFLIACPKLRDGNFFKTVVLMVEHGPEGAMGLIINRPSSVTLANGLNGHFELPEDGELIFTGGPVEPSALFMIHNSADLDPTENPVLPGLYMGGSAEVFEAVVQSKLEGEPGLKFRVFSGCAGWAPDQLEGELERGDWLTVQGCCDYVFNEAPYSVWDRALSESQAAHRLFSLDCDHPEWN